MTMIQELYDVIAETKVASLHEFINSEPEWYDAFCKRYPDFHDNDDFDIHAHISSDMCEIQAILDADHRIWSVDYIEDSRYNDDYFLIRQWEKVERMKELFQSLVMFCDEKNYDISEWEMENDEE